MNIKPIILGFILAYLIISLPEMLGVGKVIDWVPESTLLQKFKVYLIEGITTNYLLKIVISVIVSVIFSMFLSRR
ncbi:hypothetical protein SAMN04488053_102359 [Alkalicoccus daliensis]|uniref:DUF4321 domain-containing protein n=1 Tax=Alkalicoccus daliensis TaxID=745820 RepID=A0A1H0D6Q3_9BACI|nr:hypothetical protein SAMN04488053_102359 [Alkalicoccus daliensis]